MISNITISASENSTTQENKKTLDLDFTKRIQVAKESITRWYDAHRTRPSDIYEHLPTLRKYATECEHITEMGVRGVVSTWSFLDAHPKRLVSIDIVDVAIGEARRLATDAGVSFTFIQADTGSPNLVIEETDLLFIDTWHVYEHLTKELALHSDRVKKYIIMHDTTIFGEKGESEGHVGLWPAVEEFIARNKNWTIKERYTNNNGLTVLERV